jgi:beta-1,4-mannosyl-glycoprotein beta-1,4-N-acetylglucosaminyltransferase
MVYDCFLFFNELELLDIRLHELQDVVDKFVLVESPYTFTGISKPLHYENNKGLFKEFHDRIVHLIYDPLTCDPDPWVNETNQRNYLLQGVGPEKNGYIILSDVDEIPRAHAAGRNYTRATCLCMTRYDFFLNCKADNLWWGTKIIPLSQEHINLQNERDTRWPGSTLDWIMDAGWHFSYLGCTRDDGYKIQSFSHASEVTNPLFKNEKFIVTHLQMGVHPYGAKLGKYSFVPIDYTYPEYVLQNQERFAPLIWIS